MIIKKLGVTNYLDTLNKMQQFSKNRDKNTKDELWVTQHYNIFTTGIQLENNNILKKTAIPIIKTDRGGKITYHGLGQVVIYLLLDIKKLQINIKKVINLIEQAVINLLKQYNINAGRKNKMPGVYVNNAKISALGLKVKNGKIYHGLSLNVAMDLTPFKFINPCGYASLKVCQMSDFYKNLNIATIEQQLVNNLTNLLTK